MASVFVDILRDIRGQGDLNSINASPGVAANAGLPASFTDGGIYQRIKDKEANVSEMEANVDGISVNIYGTDPVSGSSGSIWKDIILRSNQVSLDASQVASDRAEVAMTAGNQYEAEASRMTAESFATEPENVEVKEYISNGDGTYSQNILTGVYSSLHWNAKAQLIGDARMEHYNQELAPIPTQRGATWFKESTGAMSIWTNISGVDQWVSITGGSQVATNETNFIATLGQTDFSVVYDPTSMIETYRNGVRLSDNMFDAISGTNIVLHNAADVGDIVDVIEILPAIACGCTGSGSGSGVGIEHYNQELPPSPNESGATWYQPSTMKTFKYVNDGSADLWTDISAGSANFVGHVDKTRIVATTGQSIFNVTYDTANTDLFMHVNGIMIDQNEYDATSGTDVHLYYGLNNGDIVEFDVFEKTPAPVGSLSIVDYKEILYEPVAIGTDTFAVTYDLIDFVEVYRNGFKLASSNYDATSGVDIVLNTPTSTSNETIEIIVFKTQTSTNNSEDCNLIINGNFASNSRGAANKLDTSNDPAGEYSYDMWVVVAGVLQQRIADGRYTPNTVYTLSGTNIVTQQITSPAGGIWTIDTGTADPDNVILNIGTVIKNCPFNDEEEIARSKKYYNKVQFAYKGYANGKVTQYAYMDVKMAPGATVIQECPERGGLVEPADGLYVDYDFSENEDYLHMYTREYLSPGAYDFKINLIFDASL